ncbi:cache domain-containing protein [Marinitoga aeolica]|uniref:Cache domain-containing protein n=1 Tax=Marinitoga aeolica TaxID=2809031 RepID=A0ABY8PS57_9BACT|nr:hypothetical protein [Marinitoga aeolica]WGS65445.1 cache domain-containing protein [Marinitoga aeolica]
MKKQESFKDFFVFSLIIFISLYIFLFYMNTSYLERTVEEIINRSSISVVNTIDEYNKKYENLSKDFSNDIRISSYTKSLVYISSNFDDSRLHMYEATYKRLDEYIKEKMGILSFNGKVIITDFDKNILYPQKVNLLDYNMFETNLIALENSKGLIKHSPIFSFNDKTFFYLSTFIFDVNQIPIGYLSFEVNVNFDWLRSFSMKEISFYIVDNKTKLIWPGISLPYFIYSKLFLSKEENRRFNFNGKVYDIKKTNFGDSIFLLSIFENRNLYIYSVMYFILITLFFVSIMMVWIKKYFQHEINISKKLFDIAEDLELENEELIVNSIKNIKHIRKALFQNVSSFEELENKIVDAIRVYDDIIYISFYRKRISNIDYTSYEIYSSENYNISDGTIEILKSTKNFYEYSFKEKIFDLDGFLIIKENKFGDVEKSMIFDGVLFLLKELYIKKNKIYSIEDLKKFYFEKSFRTILIAKFDERVINLKAIDTFRSYVFRVQNNLIFLNTFDSHFNNEIIEYIDIICEFEKVNAKFISFRIPKYEAKKKKLFKEIEKVLNTPWGKIENSY